MVISLMACPWEKEGNTTAAAARASKGNMTSMWVMVLNVLEQRYLLFGESHDERSPIIIII